MDHRLAARSSLLPLLAALAGCATAPPTATTRNDLKASARDALGQMQADDPTLSAHFLKAAHGYVVFPSVGKGAYVVGGSYGRGIVYRQGRDVGYADISQVSVGFQAGGQTFMELIAFEDAAAMRRFESGKLSLTGNVSIVIIKSGAAASAKYGDGVAVFVKPVGGAMVEASVGGQQFTYQAE